MKRTTFKRKMKKGINPIKSDAENQRAWVAPVLDWTIDDPMDTAKSEDERAKYGSNAEIMMMIRKSGIKGLIAEEFDRIHRNALKQTSEINSRKLSWTCFDATVVPHRMELKRRSTDS